MGTTNSRCGFTSNDHELTEQVCHPCTVRTSSLFQKELPVERLNSDARQDIKNAEICTEIKLDHVPVSRALQAWLQMAPAPGTPCFDTLRECYPTALPKTVLMQRIVAATDPYGLTPENTIYGQSVCPDEINHEKEGLAHCMAEYWGECFPMGGIGGAPHVGRTGYKAFSHHVPDNGNVLVLFGAHVAISEGGELGKVLRPGQCNMSTSCGAVLAAYSACCKGCDHEFDQEDMQQWWLHNKVSEQYGRIKSAKFPIQELTNVAYESVEEKIDTIVNNDFGKGYLVLIGGITINLPKPFEDHFVPRLFQIRCHDGSVTDLLPSLEVPSTGDMSAPTVDIRNGIQHFLSWASLTPPHDNRCAIAMQRNFPGALPGALMIKRLATILDKFGLDPENTIYGQSICPDEINHEKGGFAPSMVEHWGECFPMGGIGGAPYVGKTGFKAFSHHVPDGGNVLIMFGTHIAISEQGELGKVMRIGQSKHSDSCGAVLAAYAQCCNGSCEANSFDVTDMQQWWLREQIKQSLPQIKNAVAPHKALITVAYEAVKDKILRIVNNDFGNGHLVLLGGISINMPPPYKDHFYPLMFQLREHGGRQHDLLSALHEVSFGGMTLTLA